MSRGIGARKSEEKQKGQTKEAMWHPAARFACFVWTYRLPQRHPSCLWVSIQAHASWHLAFVQSRLMIFAKWPDSFSCSWPLWLQSRCSWPATASLRLLTRSSAPMEDALVQCVQLSLANCLTSNATFYAEQLVAISRQNDDDSPSEHSIHLLAMCYIQSGRHSLALKLLKGCISQKNLYLRAVAALALNLHREAESALLPPYGIRSEEDYNLVPNGAYGIYILGVVKRYVSFEPLASALNRIFQPSIAHSRDKTYLATFSNLFTISFT